MNLYKNCDILELKNFVVLINRAELICRCRLMYSKSFIHKFLICIILLVLFDISLLYDMTTDIYKGYLKIAVLVAVGCHLDLYLELSKQEELIVQAFKNNTFDETYELLNTKYMAFIISFVVLMTINLIKY